MQNERPFDNTLRRKQKFNILLSNPIPDRSIDTNSTRFYLPFEKIALAHICRLKIKRRRGAYNKYWFYIYIKKGLLHLNNFFFFTVLASQ